VLVARPTPNMNRRQNGRSVRGTLPFYLLLIVPLFCGQTKAQVQPRPSKEQPLLKIDMRKYGYKPYGTGMFDSLSLAFVDGKELLVGWTKLDSPPDNAGRRTSRPAPRGARTGRLVMKNVLGNGRRLISMPRSPR
jgi:hypothetical protein